MQKKKKNENPAKSAEEKKKKKKKIAFAKLFTVHSNVINSNDGFT